MQIIRFQFRDEPLQYGWLQGNEVGRMDGNPFTGYQRLDPEILLDRVKLLPPVVPGKIICVGRNYPEHAKELNNDQPTLPILFIKPASAVIGPGAPIELPPQSTQVDYEGELAVVIGKKGRWISVDRVKEFIFGYTISNDVTARDLQKADGQWTRAKGFDTFCPLGPLIETDFNPFDAVVTTHINGQLRQMASTRDMTFSVHQLIAFISSIMTLDPGDVILTGTPAGVGPLADGDMVRVSIEGIGELLNPVVKTGSDSQVSYL